MQSSKNVNIKVIYLPTTGNQISAIKFHYLRWIPILKKDDNQSQWFVMVKEYDQHERPTQSASCTVHEEMDREKDTVNQGNWCLYIKLRIECFVIVA